MIVLGRRAGVLAGRDEIEALAAEARDLRAELGRAQGDLRTERALRLEVEHRLIQALAEVGRLRGGLDGHLDEDDRP